MRSYSETIGDGTTKTFTIMHGLGTEDVIVALYNDESRLETADPFDVIVDSADAVLIDFGAGLKRAAPDKDSYRVVVHG